MKFQKYILVFRRVVPLALLGVLFSSCATLLNNKVTRIEVLSDSPIKAVTNKDTVIASKDGVIALIVPRQKAPLELTVFNDSISSTFSIKSKNAPEYWLNIYFNYGIGMFFDRNKPQRYSYPKNLYFTKQNNGFTYTTYEPFNKIKYKSNIKFTPLRLIGIVHPGFEVSYERQFNRRFSTQLSATCLFNFYNSINEEYTGSGFEVGLEERYYLSQGKNRPYISLEADYFKINYHAETNYGYEYVSPNYNDPTVTDTFYASNKSLIYLTPKIGYQLSVTDRFLVEAYFGVGIQHAKTTYVNDLDHNNKAEDKYTVVKVPFNFKFGWRF